MDHTHWQKISHYGQDKSPLKAAIFVLVRIFSVPHIYRLRQVKVKSTYGPIVAHQARTYPGYLGTRTARSGVKSTNHEATAPSRMVRMVSMYNKVCKYSVAIFTDFIMHTYHSNHTGCYIYRLYYAYLPFEPYGRAQWPHGQRIIKSVNIVSAWLVHN